MNAKCNANLFSLPKRLAGCWARQKFIFFFSLVFCAHIFAAAKINTLYWYLEGLAGIPSGINTGLLYSDFIGNGQILIPDFHYQSDNQDGYGGNLGLGYRKKTSKTSNVHGLYLFGSHQKTLNDSIFNQANLGVEAYVNGWSFINNWYIPYGNQIVTLETLKHKRRVHSKEPISKNTQFEEIVLPGFDVNIGNNFPGSSVMSFMLTYYHYGFNSEFERVDGGTVQISFTPNSALTIDLNDSYDHLSGNELGLTFQFFINAIWNKNVNLTAAQQIMVNDVTFDSIPYTYIRVAKNK